MRATRFVMDREKLCQAAGDGPLPRWDRKNGDPRAGRAPAPAPLSPGSSRTCRAGTRLPSAFLWEYNSHGDRRRQKRSMAYLLMWAT